MRTCKERVRRFRAQTEQSIRIGQWMDWTDPHELRRRRDLLADRVQERMITAEGPRGLVTDTVEQIVGRLGMPDRGWLLLHPLPMRINDLIWGFLAECRRRGWLYKGHDTRPWRARRGTGISQHEMSEGYQDREDPGLTVQLPLLDLALGNCFYD